ncbi:MAG: histidinol dehydrogenase [Fretibacterium sp.]|nr:histidinol dehydrogenase [Fretibacterium sp.]
MIKLLKYGDVPDEEIFARGVEAAAAQVSAAVAEILSAVRREGDAALLRYEEKFDGVKLAALEVPTEERRRGAEEAGPEFTALLERAAANIRRFHQRQVRNGFILTGSLSPHGLAEEGGIVLGQRVIPLDRVGLYVPGGTASYPSTVLMDAIPAKTAGCGEVVMVTPPRKDGTIAPAILAAAEAAGVDRVFRLGGAQAVAALAFGTESVPRVDKIVGPGNVYVAEAKRQVFGAVAIDMIAGPSEILIVAEGSSQPREAPRWLAADLLSQAEHDRMASAVLVTDSMELAQAVRDELEVQIPRLDRAEIARASIENNGKIIVVGDIAHALDISNALAPEHLELCVEAPFAWLGRVRHAGSVFLGWHCPEALGDYYAGPNHTLPTSGTARFSSPLSVDDFVKKSQYTYYAPEAMRRAAPDVAAFARAEGLTGHAKSALARLAETEEV